MDMIIWRKSSYSSGNGGNCVEAANIGHTVAIRDSKNPSGPKLAFRPDDWRAFTRSLKNGK
jgi:hypothetical protein